MAIHIRVANATADLKAIYRFRAQAGGGDDASKCPPELDDRFVDRYDSFATTRNVLIQDGNETIGTLRVAAESELGLPGNGLRNFESIRPYLKGKVIGIDQLRVAKSYRARPGVLIAAMKVALQVARGFRGDHLLVNTPSVYISPMETMGLSAVGPPAWNESIQAELVPVYGALSGLQSPFLEWLQGPLVEALGPFFHRAIYREGEIICREGEAGECAYVVARGSVCVTSQARSGAEILIGLLGPGELFGELALLDAGPRMATVKAHAQETDLAVIERAVFNDVIMGDPARVASVLQLLARRLRGSSARMVSLSPQSAIPLLIQVIMDAADSLGVTAGGLLGGVTLEWLAGQVGRPPALVKRLTDVLERKELLVWTPEGLWIHDLDALMASLDGQETGSRQSPRRKLRSMLKGRHRNHPPARFRGSWQLRDPSAD